jgi:hypothetical protein
MRWNASSVMRWAEACAASRSSSAGDATTLLGRTDRICASSRTGSIAPGARRSASGITLVTPEARFASTKIGSVQRSTSPGASRRLSTSARCCASRKPWVRTAAFGVPVDPLVKVMMAGVSASHGSDAARPADARPIVTVAGSHRPITQAVGIARIADDTTRSRCARGTPMSTAGATRRTHRSSCACPADGSTNTAVARSRNKAMTMVYRSIDIG